MASLFQKAKQTAPKTTGAKTKEKVVIKVDLGEKLKDLQQTRDEIKQLEAKAEMLEGDIKPVAREQFLNLLKREGVRPDSFVLSSGCGSMLVIVQDKYLKITEGKEKTLEDNGLQDVIDEQTVYSFNADLLTKYENEISAAISKIKGIPTEDKEKLIEAKVVKSIKKGTIDRLPQFKNPDLAFTLIEPIVQLKNQ